MMPSRFLIIVATLLIVPIGTIDFASGDGVIIPNDYMEITESGQRAILAWNGATEMMYLSVDIETSDYIEGIHIIPFPSPPSIWSVDKSVFNYVSRAIDFRSARIWGPDDSMSNEDVSRYIIKDHNITVISVNGSSDLRAQLIRLNGNEESSWPDRLDDVVDRYVARGYHYFSVDRYAMNGSSTLSPLVFEFQTDSLFFPLMISSPMDGPSSLDIIAIYPDVPINMTEGRSELDLFMTGTFTRDSLNLIDDGLGYFMQTPSSAYMLFKGFRNLESLTEDLVIRVYHGDDWMVNVRGYEGQNILRSPDRTDLLLSYYCVPSVLREDLRCIDPLSGKVLWSFPLPSRGDPQGRLVLNGDMDGNDGDEIIVMDFNPGGMTLTRLNEKDGAIVWSRYHNGVQTWPRSESDVIRYEYDYWTRLNPQFVTFKDDNGTHYIVPDKFNRMIIDVDGGNITRINSDRYSDVRSYAYHGLNGDILVRSQYQGEFCVHTELYYPGNDTIMMESSGIIFPFMHQGSDYILNSGGDFDIDAIGDLDDDGDLECVLVNNWKHSNSIDVVDLFSGSVERSVNVSYVDKIVIEDERLIVIDGWSFTSYNMDLAPLFKTNGLFRGSSFDWNGDGVKDIVATNETAFRVIDGANGEVLATFDPYGDYLHAMTDLDTDGKKELLFSISGTTVAVENDTQEKLLTNDLIHGVVPGEWAGNWICRKGDYENDLGDYFIQKKEGIEYVPKEDFVSLKAEREMITDEMEVRFNLDTWLLKKAVQGRDITIDTGPHGSLAKGLLRLNDSYGSFVFKPDQGYEGPCSVSVRINVTPEVVITKSASVYVMKSPIAPNVTIPHEEWFEPQDLRPMEHAFLKVKLDAGYFDHWINAMIEDPSDLEVVALGRDNNTWSFSFVVPKHTDRIRFRIDIVKGGTVVSNTWIEKNITKLTSQIVSEGKISLETPELGDYAIIGSAIRVIVHYTGDPLVGDVRFRFDDGSTSGYIANIKMIAKDTWYFFHIVPDMGYFTLKVTLVCGEVTVSESSRFILSIGGIGAIISEDLTEKKIGVEDENIDPHEDTDDTGNSWQESARPTPELEREHTGGLGSMIILILMALSLLGVGYAIYFIANFINGRRNAQ